jgi:hypothetical protein
MVDRPSFADRSFAHSRADVDGERMQTACCCPIASVAAVWYKQAIFHFANTLWHRRLVSK